MESEEELELLIKIWSHEEVLDGFDFYFGSWFGTMVDVRTGILGRSFTFKMCLMSS